MLAYVYNLDRRLFLVSLNILFFYPIIHADIDRVQDSVYEINSTFTGSKGM
jgi:hypothetical protein